MITPRDIAVPLQRITWRDGQTLLSRDLHDDQHYGDSLRHLHIRYLHRTWGVVEGFQVVALGSGAVLVGPGYALGINGRELLRPLAIRIAAPANIVASQTMYLVLSHGPYATCKTTPDLATLCTVGASAASIEQADLSWKSVTEVQPGNDILLGRVLIADGRIASAFDSSIQRRAATLDLPRMWSDVTQQGQTGWTLSPESQVSELRAVINTSDAGFVATPAYFAQLTGTSPTTTGFIELAAPASFTFVARFASACTRAAAPTPAQAESAGWTISWFAIDLMSERAEPLTALIRRLA